MRTLVACTLSAFSFIACNQSEKNSPETTGVRPPVEKASFFPVTSFLKGQLFLLSKEPVTPMRTITIGNKTDSSWIKKEDVNGLVTDFFTPVIDSLNMIHFFKEEKFNDASLNAFTLTYDPRVKLPDSIPLRHWDVYIDAETGEVSKVYIVKNKMDSSLQLTWVNGNSCSIRAFSKKPDGSLQLEREEKITWKF